jgi:protein-L-isoaspartate(D-aspartate) O-methyltransferase
MSAMEIGGVDTVQHQLQRERLVAEIRSRGITDERVLSALNAVPRHFFVNKRHQDLAYVDRPKPIGYGQTISQPYTVAYQTQLLDVDYNDKILEVGTGSAYQACVLAQIGWEIFTIKRQRKLFDKYRHSWYLHSINNVHFFYGDGHEGLPTYAPYDKILVTAASEKIPAALIDQLAINGYLVIPVGSVDQYRLMMRITKSDDGRLMKETFSRFSFVPMNHGTTE